MIRIAHLADLHLGYSQFSRLAINGQNQREADFERSALAVADYLVEDKPDLVVVAGDTLHDTRVSNTALNGAVEFFDRLRAADIPTIVIGGNHDEAGSPGRFNALHLLKRHGVQLYLEQDSLDICGVRLHLVPFQVLARFLRGRGELAPFIFSSDAPNILVSHGYTVAPKMPTPPEEVIIPPDWLTDPRFNLVCLGHIHHHFRVEGYEHVFYSGSLERRDFGERNETPGFWIHEISDDGITSKTITVEELGLELTPRPMIQYELEASSMTTDALSEEVQKLVSNDIVEGAMVRIVLTNVSAELDRSRSRSQWLRAFRSAGGFNLDVVAQTKRVTELLDVQFASPPVNVAEAFTEFLEQQQYATDEDRTQIISLGAEVMAVAHEKLLSQETE